MAGGFYKPLYPWGPKFGGKERFMNCHVWGEIPGKPFTELRIL